MRNLVLFFRHHHWLLISLMLGAVWYTAVRVYYYIKPSLPEWARLAMRRWWSRRRRKASLGSWPILESAGIQPPGWPGWPEGRQFVLVLSHDVETQKGVERVKQLAELEMSFGYRSCFNFIPEGPYEVPGELRNWLEDRGFEVAVHDHRHDGKLFQSRARFCAGAERINHFLREWNAVGFRAGYMLHNMEWIGELDILYDSSTFDTDPFEPQPEGMNTIFPFWIASANSRGYVELPYTLVQDSTLFVMLQEKSIDVWKQKTEWIASRGGMALLTVHPDYTAFDKTAVQRTEFPVEWYAAYLKWIKDSFHGKYWHALPREVAAYYRQSISAHSPAGSSKASSRADGHIVSSQPD